MLTFLFDFSIFDFSLLDVSVVASSEEFDPNTVTPGVIGFFAIFFIATATVLLVLDMTRRVRRTRYRGEVRERLDAEEALAAEAAAVERARATDAASKHLPPDAPQG